MANMTKDTVVRMEKRRVNRGGLFLLIVFVVGALGFGIFYSIKHPEFIKSLFGKDDTYIEEKKDKDGNVVIGNNDLKKVEISNAPIYQYADFSLVVTSVDYSKNGYTVKLKEEVNGIKPRVEIYCDDILLDGYSTGLTFEIKAVTDTPGEAEVFIKKTILSELEMVQFDKMTFFLNISSYDTNGNVDKNKYTGSVTSTNLEKENNSKGNITFIDEKADIAIYFYKLLNDKENYYFYFLIKNNSNQYNADIEVNKFFINDELYNYEELDMTLHYNSTKFFYLKVPKKSFDKIESFRISYFLVVDRSPSELDNAIYITTSNDIKV